MDIKVDDPLILYIGIILGIYSIICGIISIYLYKRGNRMSINTTGTIIGFEKRLFQSSSIISSHPVVEFTDNNGSKQKFVPWRGGLISIYNIDQKVKVQYNPDNPSEAAINSEMSAAGRLITQLLLFVFTFTSFFISILLLGVYFLFHFGIVHLYLTPSV
jgi:hypothetical protein